MLPKRRAKRPRGQDDAASSEDDAHPDSAGPTASMLLTTEAAAEAVQAQRSVVAAADPQTAGVAAVSTSASSFPASTTAAATAAASVTASSISLERFELELVKFCDDLRSKETIVTNLRAQHASADEVDEAKANVAEAKVNVAEAKVNVAEAKVAAAPNDASLLLICSAAYRAVARAFRAVPPAGSCEKDAADYDLIAQDYTQRRENLLLSLPAAPAPAAPVADVVDLMFRGKPIAVDRKLLRPDLSAPPTSFFLRDRNDFTRPIVYPETLDRFLHVLGHPNGDNRAPIGFLFGTSGWGKSFMMEKFAELTNIARGGTDFECSSSRLSAGGISILQEYVPIAITFNNHTMFNEALDKSSVNGLCRRVLHSYFFSDIDSLDEGDVPTDLGDVTLADLCLGILEYVKPNIPNAEILLLVDELAMVPNYDEALLGLRELMVDMNGRLRLVISSLVPVWANNSVEGMCTGSGRKFINIPLPVSSEEEVVNATYDALVSIYRSRPVYAQAARTVAFFCGGHWRTVLQYVMFLAKRRDRDRTAGQQLDGPYEVGISLPEDLLPDLVAHAALSSSLSWRELVQNVPCWRLAQMAYLLQPLDLDMTRKHFQPIVLLSEVLDFTKQSTDALLRYKVVLSNLLGSSRIGMLPEDKPAPRTDVVNIMSEANAVADENYKRYEMFARWMLLLRWFAHRDVDHSATNKWNNAFDGTEVDPVHGTRPVRAVVAPGAKRAMVWASTGTDPEIISSEEFWSTIRDCVLHLRRDLIQPPNDRVLWLVPPDWSRVSTDKRPDGIWSTDRDYLERRNILRGAELLTSNRRKELRVLAPDPESARIYSYSNQLSTLGGDLLDEDGTPVPYDSPILPAGSIVYSKATNNPGFDFLAVLDTTTPGQRALLLFELKFVAKTLTKDQVQAKLNLMRGDSYKGLFRNGKLARSLHLGHVEPRNVVIVFLLDVEVSTQTVLDYQVMVENIRNFDAQVFLTSSKQYFGPTFKRVELLARRIAPSDEPAQNQFWASSSAAAGSASTSAAAGPASAAAADGIAEEEADDMEI